MNEDVISEIFSHCSTTEIAKFRLLNKECNKRSYEFNFIDRQIHRTNSVFGFFVHYGIRWVRYRPYFISSIGKEPKTQISIDFIPSYNAKIEACDSQHGILLCIDELKFKRDHRIPDYIVCKPATKEYRIIPNPKTRYTTITIGIMVISSSPFRYKIIRVSKPKTWWTKGGFCRYNCEVFDSDSFKWKRLSDVTLPGYFPRVANPVSAYGCLHWFTYDKHVVQFCMETETWSIFQVPDELIGDWYVILVSYDGKLGAIHSKLGKESDLWVLESRFKKSWVKVKDAKLTVLKDNKARPLWFPSNDAVSVACIDQLGLYNMNSNSCRYLPRKRPFGWFNYDPDYCFVPFYSNYDRVGLNKDKESKVLKV